METIISLLWFVGIVVGLYFGIKWLVFKFRSIRANQDLEVYMANVQNENSVVMLSHVKALLLVRGQYLSKELRVAAENWVDEMEEKSKGK